MSEAGRSTRARAGDSGQGPKKSVPRSQLSRQHEGGIVPERRAGLPRAEPPGCCPSRHTGPQCPRDQLAHAGAPPLLGRVLHPSCPQVNLLSYVQLTSLALPSLTDSKGSLVVVSSLLGRVPASFSSPYSAAKFALDSFFGALQRELHVQDVNVAITRCVLGLQDGASAKEGVREAPLP
ncbi:PREDICTED: hydroxysteroid 11-beta-dehydrogenase 1-like protein isoform X2 [Myotis brandtii]|uniref:hydroxysteroid 11-beta-dehydrogenase 1-like protein isoform X2 n=1 Tax=Myotis brandtii TaxID=109478 RepID=UPI000703EC14|nr:PREDICTED: hydroxysteroid 11-beta-dehydrogenase 1-like protein isoform X2 [Myotis brandtii]